MTDEIIIRPHLGVGEIDFGMSLAEVSRALGATAERTPRGDREYSYRSLGLFAHFDREAERCSAVTIIPAEGRRLLYDGYSLFEHPAIDVLEWARRLDPDISIRKLIGAFTSRALGLEMSADWVHESEIQEDERRQSAEYFHVFDPTYLDARDRYVAESLERFRGERS